LRKQAQGGKAYGIAADVGKDADNKRIVDETMEKYGRLDVSFINAGVVEKALFCEVMICFHTYILYYIIFALCLGFTAKLLVFASL
jgi:short-subunit dehydrogenase